MPPLPRFDVAHIRANDPCYDPVTGVDKWSGEVVTDITLTEDWEGTLLDIIEMEVCDEDVVWLMSIPG